MRRRTNSRKERSGTDADIEKGSRWEGDVSFAKGFGRDEFSRGILTTTPNFGLAGLCSSCTNRPSPPIPLPSLAIGTALSIVNCPCPFLIPSHPLLSTSHRSTMRYPCTRWARMRGTLRPWKASRNRLRDCLPLRGVGLAADVMGILDIFRIVGWLPLVGRGCRPGDRFDREGRRKDGRQAATGAAHMARRDLPAFLSLALRWLERVRTGEIKRCEFRKCKHDVHIRGGRNGDDRRRCGAQSNAFCKRRVSELRCQFCACSREPFCDDQPGSTKSGCESRGRHQSPVGLGVRIKGPGGRRMEVTAQGMERPRSDHHHG